MPVTSEQSAGAKATHRTAKRLSVYLNDQLGDETHGLELATQASLKHKGSPLGDFLLLLSWQLEEDRESLVRLMRKLGVRRKRVAIVMGGMAEKVGQRLSLINSPPPSAMVELESLDLRISGKLDMWNALRSSLGDRVDGIDFDAVIHRTERQAEALERRRLTLAADALPYRDASTPVRSGTKLAAAR